MQKVLGRRISPRTLLCVPWAVLGLSLLSLALWDSWFDLSQSYRSGTRVSVRSGKLLVTVDLNPTTHSWAGKSLSRHSFGVHMPLRLPIMRARGKSIYYIASPLWFLFICAMLGLLGTLCVRRRGQGYPAGHCRSCGYNLTGNVSGRCPECGCAVSEKRRVVRSSWNLRGFVYPLGYIVSVVVMAYAVYLVFFLVVGC